MFLAKIETISQYCKEIYLIKFLVENRDRYLFYPGQYMDVMLPNSSKISLSISSSPSQTEIECFIKKSSTAEEIKLLKSIKQKKLSIKISSPKGGACLYSDTNKHIICIAHGIGISPVMSIILHHVENKLSRHLEVHWFLNEIEIRSLSLYVEKLCKNKEQITLYKYLSPERKENQESFLNNISNKYYFFDAICFIYGSQSFVSHYANFISSNKISEYIKTDYILNQSMLKASI